MIETLPEFELSATNLTQTAFTLVEGRNLWATLSPHMPIVMADGIGRRHRGVIIRPIGQGADNNTYDYKVWHVRRAGETRGSPSAVGANDYHITLIANGTCTLSSSTGLAGAAVLTNADFLVDTITLTKSATLTHWESVFGAGLSVNSVLTERQAEIAIPDAYNAFAIIFEIDLVTATGANALVELFT